MRNPGHRLKGKRCQLNWDSGHPTLQEYGSRSEAEVVSILARLGTISSDISIRIFGQVRSSPSLPTICYVC